MDNKTLNCIKAFCNMLLTFWRTLGASMVLGQRWHWPETALCSGSDSLPPPNLLQGCCIHFYLHTWWYP